MLISFGELDLAIGRVNGALNSEESIEIVTTCFDLPPLYFKHFELHIVINLILTIGSIPALLRNDMSKLPSSLATFLILTPITLQHIVMTMPLKEQCLIFLLESQTEFVTFSYFVGSLEAEATFRWMLTFALDMLGRVVEGLEGQPMNYCVVVLIVFEEIASPIRSNMCHQPINYRVYLLVRI